MGGENKINIIANFCHRHVHRIYEQLLFERLLPLCTWNAVQGIECEITVKKHAKGKDFKELNFFFLIFS